MWQLICQHTYKYQGCAIDLSPFHNDGTRTTSSDPAYSADGQTHGSGVLRFETQTGRVTVPPNDIWSNLGAVKVQSLVRVDSGRNAVRIIVFADQSFAFGMDADGDLYAFVFQPGQVFQCRSDTANSPDGKPHLVPTERWIELGMICDGVGNFIITVDNKVVGRNYVPPGISKVANRGLAIGNAHDHSGGGPLLGEIDEIKIWRYHPNSILNEFCARPIDRGVAKCWENLIAGTRQALAQDPDCAQAIRLAVGAAIGRALHTAAGFPAPVQQELTDLLQEYINLWQTGQLATPQMQAVIQKLVDLLRANGLDLANDGEFDAFARTPCLAEIVKKIDGIDCDPEFRGLLKLISKAQGSH